MAKDSILNIETEDGKVFVSITIKPTPPDADLMQDLHREEIETKYSESEIDAISRAGLAGARAGGSWAALGNWKSLNKIGALRGCSTEALLNVALAAGKLGVTIKPEPMKKHELLKHAYDNYPKGTLATWYKNKDDQFYTEFISTGIFDFDDDGDIFIVYPNKDDVEYVFIQNDWATVIQAKTISILSGKCAIQVNNEREFKLLMEHYDGKGWKWYQNQKPLEYGGDNQTWPRVITYEDEFVFTTKGQEIPFADFAKEVGIEVPVFVRKTHDGINLYVKDDCYVPQSAPKGYSHFTMISARIEWKDNTNSHFFHSKEAAEAWIKEQNKPSVIRLKLDGGEAIVTKDKITIHLGKEAGRGYHMEATEIEPIYAAYKSLQP